MRVWQLQSQRRKASKVDEMSTRTHLCRVGTNDWVVGEERRFERGAGPRTRRKEYIADQYRYTGEVGTYRDLRAHPLLELRIRSLASFGDLGRIFSGRG
jgi:hypothetical protein